MSRKVLAKKICALAPDVLEHVSGDGWPSLVDVKVGRDVVRTALHCGPIGGSHRNRDDERRFQNPGKDRPVTHPPETIPLLIGFYEDTRPVLVGMDALQRIGKITRQSFFLPLHLIERGVTTGWASHVSDSQETIYSFLPGMLPVFVDLSRQGLLNDIIRLDEVTDASGLLEEEEKVIPIERARRTSLRVVRDQRFRKTVIQAYEGFCAMCGFDLGLIEAAHIYPATAPHSQDTIRNGLALCSNHHVAFDRHKIFIDPESLEIRFHPVIHQNSQVNAASKAFIDMTYRNVKVPARQEHAPAPEMFDRRYGHFKGMYNWTGYESRV